MILKWKPRRNEGKKGAVPWEDTAWTWQDTHEGDQQEVSHGKMQGMWTDKASKMARKPGARRLFLTERGSELVGGGWPPSVLQYGEPPSRK